MTLYFFEHLPPRPLGRRRAGGARRTIRMIAGHIHNSRCTWLKTLGAPHGFPSRPWSIGIGSEQAASPALRRSGNGITRLLQLGCDHGGTIPPTRPTSGATCRWMWVTSWGISSRTRGITVDRSCWWPGPSASGCRESSPRPLAVVAAVGRGRGQVRSPPGSE